jgi:hypothetical protein
MRDHQTKRAPGTIRGPQAYSRPFTTALWPIKDREI